MSEKILYFAYGSNIKTDRLQGRISSARVMGRGRLVNKRLTCSKKSKDGSGKANLEDGPREEVWGVLYEIDPSELKLLDKIEGDYRRVTMKINTDEEKVVEAEVYTSTELTSEVIPYDWYKELLICGARDHQLPENNIEFLERLPSKQDSNEG